MINYIMAEFKGTIKEFHKFIGPRIRNQIQSLTKKAKRELKNICQHCNKTKELEAAHMENLGRKLIIEKVLKSYIKKNIVVINDLEKVEKIIKNNHIPITKYFKFLCKKCHTFYDKK